VDLNTKFGIFIQILQENVTGDILLLCSTLWRFTTFIITNMSWLQRG